MRDEKVSSNAWDSNSMLFPFTVMDECEPNPCHNGGKCVDKFDGFHCICYGGWNGPTCRGESECLIQKIHDVSIVAGLDRSMLKIFNTVLSVRGN